MPMACSASGRWVPLVAVEQGAGQQRELEPCTKLCVQRVDDDILLTCKSKGSVRQKIYEGATL